MEAYFMPRRVPTVHTVDPQVAAAAAAQHRDDNILQALDTQFSVDQEHVIDIMSEYWGPYSS
ncbi:hypothetical protein I6I10_06325 [Corynebacterium glucuronolyticum]|uniref:Uncharacterized protein n=3 Tax=Corynebacteriaceae TaxID=1653 RepID=A0A7T4JW23_9CORY|nr:hypothetical protein HMPREF0294_1525 [Corynebacterium glucuronolyticum ATCC 51867]EEI62181.1 hypothetical protein HMPREF0293_2306 [Corynebacterium glucuronolyticum ATCC 51866]OFO42561.1 hypothetical protein HMPREF3044_06195 [Corynebacterium sp. HMSC073D01]QQB47490.1 hypothetical protein I6I10_06325 [Corynebacterium glucuronolyticum]WKD64163.1 hypothetical protein CGLUCO_09615 [Corynebacterium glucuronolyticum DSM 44120]